MGLAVYNNPLSLLDGVQIVNLVQGEAINYN